VYLRAKQAKDCVNFVGEENFDNGGPLVKEGVSEGMIIEAVSDRC
jgi:hypothetical protein